MAVVKHGAWEILVPQKVAENPSESAKIIEVLKEIERVSTDEKADEPTLTSTSA